MAFRSFMGNERGGFAPRRGRGGARPFMKRAVVKPDTEKHPLGQLLQTLSISDLEVPTGGLLESSTITDCEYIASYNWTSAKSATILVPGKPPLWTPLQQSKRLPEDSGDYFRDPNAAKFPTFPTEPAVRALFETDSNFPTEAVDIFACGSTMGSLLRFVRSIDKPFRFHIELVGSTVFLVRKENDPRETIDGVRGYGHTFPDEYTTWEQDVKGSESHQRLCRYKFGRFKCAVRFECDGYLPHGSKKVGSSSTMARGSNLDSVLDSLENVTVGQSLTDATETLTVKSGGTVVPQNTIFDLKTRSGRYRKEIDMDEMYPQLWIRQIPNFIIAYHDGQGTFPASDIHVKNVKSGIQTWEKQNKAAIQRLAVLLDKIIEIAKQDDTGLLEAYCPSVNRLEIRKQYGGGVHALPSDLRAKWQGTGEGLDLSDQEDNDEGGLNLGNISDDEPDYTACGEDCGYCGSCTY